MSDFRPQLFKRDNKMKIDRHNYEEFFILYWDNELTASQKQAVENFIKENADLQEEFKIFGETRFTPDNNVQLEEKEFLLNKPFINITNYEEQLLNYIDNELSNEERKEVEISAAKYPTIQKELSLLQKTKLQPEAEVIFPDKSALYRREEKVRVISMTWLRVAVAAAIILIAGFVTIRLVSTNKGVDIPPVAITDKTKDQPSNNKTDQLVTQPKDQTGKDKEEILVKADDDKATQVQEAKKTASKKDVKENKTSNPLIAYQPENTNNLPKNRKINNQPVSDPNTTAGEPIAYNISKDKNKAVKSESEKTSKPFDNPDVTLQPGYALNIQEPEDGEIVSGKKEKGGLKEFLRKTTRVFERRTKIQTTTEDNKLLVGAFAVSLK